MKYIITENQNLRLKFLRRKDIIQDKIDALFHTDYFVSDPYDYKFVPFEFLLTSAADAVAVQMANEEILHGDEYITYRNQIKQFIKTNFYQHIKDFWEKYQ